MPRFRFVVDTGYPGCQHETEQDYPEAVWEAMTEAEREWTLLADANEFMRERVEVSWEVLEDRDDV